MREIQITADELVSALLAFSERETVCLLDSCGANHLGSHLLIAGVRPLEVLEITNDDAEKTLEIFDEKLSNPNHAHIFTISYDFGLKLENVNSREKEYASPPEPDVFLAAFDCLIIHDYDTRKTFLTGNENQFGVVEKMLKENSNVGKFNVKNQIEKVPMQSNFTRETYIEAVGKIKEHIRRGDTYQTNLTQQLKAILPENLTAQKVFWRLRKSNPAPFAAFIKRENDFVISASPERFLKIKQSPIANRQSPIINASPIKGTRPRGKTAKEDWRLRSELLASEKDRAENVMIVDLLRNDLGRICKFGSVEVEKLCELETHPTLYHLVSTVRGELREAINFPDIIKAVFPCGSITGAPKISTMKIIDKIETAPRGLSMGAIGYSIQSSKFVIRNSIDLNVAIRTMVIKNREAIFNVGGGVVIDSVPEDEYEESLLKAKALIGAVNGKLK
ncbi:MAG: aminodeoxychorismate synthase component I [Pyrinomonadaceae bacterium]